MISVKSLSKRYGSNRVLDGVSFDVPAETVTGFLGPNGAGKSTTLKIITGFIARSEGSVTVNGRDVLDEPERTRRMVGYLPEEPPLYRELTVDEYLLFITRFRKVPRIQRRDEMRRVKEAVGIEGDGDRVIDNLSSGYRRRVGLAQALVGDPPILILDEPTSGLDPVQIETFRRLIVEMGRSKTILLSSHILADVQAICSRVVVIDRGRIVAAGALDELTGGGDLHELFLQIVMGDGR